MNSAETKEEIKVRMLHHVSALWGVKNVESLDPLVKLLIEALAGELQKTQQEIKTFEKRILERIALQLTPGMLSSPYSAHGIVYARPTESQHTITPATSFFLKKKLQGSDSAVDLHFTPVGNAPLTDGEIKYIVTGNRVFGFDANRQKSLLLSGANNKSNKSIWIALNLGKEIESLDNIHIYFDFINLDQKRHLFTALRNAQWRSGNLVLKVESGLTGNNYRESQTVFDDYDPMLQIEADVFHLYNDQFIRISKQDHVISEDDKCFYPEALDSSFNKSELGIFKEKLLWINIDTFTFIEEKALFSLFLSMNSFPVLNRLLKEKVQRSKGISDIISLTTEPSEYFMAVKTLRDSHGKEYKQIPYSDNSGPRQGSYSIRKGGVEKTDSRTAKEQLQYLIELIRDDYAVFSGLGQDTVGSLMKELDRILLQIEQRIKQNKSFHLDSANYISLESLTANDVTFLEYWVTNSHFGNDLHPGTRLKPVKGTEVRADSVILLNATSGGKKALEPARHADAFKYALLTHNRLMTAEDLKAFCLYELGDIIEKAEVRKSFVVSDDPKEGLVKCVELLLSRKNEAAAISDQEWKVLLANAQSKIESRSALNMKLRLILAD